MGEYSTGHKQLEMRDDAALCQKLPCCASLFAAGPHGELAMSHNVMLV